MDGDEGGVHCGRQQRGEVAGVFGPWLDHSGPKETESNNSL